MSASTVPITAANSAARRRPLVTTGKKTTNIELLANDVGVSQDNAVTGGGGGDEKVTSTGNGRDLSHHTIRGEAVLERSPKDLVQARKTIGSPKVLAGRRRKVLLKSRRPRWVAVLGILFKNFVVLVVLFGLVQLIWKSIDSVGGTHEGLSEFEGPIPDVEKLLKTTTKMVQAQVDVVDRKIENEIGGLRKEVNEKIDHIGAILDSALNKLEVKSEALERSLGELKATDWLTKEELEKVYDDLKKVKGSTYGDASLDEIRANAKEMIEKEIEKHAADGLGRVDYALASGGAMVVKHSEPYLAGKGSNWFLTSAKNGVHPNAEKMLKPSFGEPGLCFALKGSSGFVQIRLRMAIIPEAVTLEHIAKSVAYDRSSAPKDCKVLGRLQGRNTESAIDSEKMVVLTEFAYDLEKSNAQTYDVFYSAASVVDTVRVDFASNHGCPSHTCIYRLRVHGHEPESVSMMTMKL